MAGLDQDSWLPLRGCVPASDIKQAEKIWKLGKFQFRADFDSANLNHVSQGSNTSEFNLWTCKDCEGTENEKGTRTWFYYGISGQDVGDFIIMNILNLNKQSRLYSQDYRPWFWSTSMKEWQPTKSKVVYKPDGENFQIRFNHKFEASEECFFAFAIPFSYLDTQALLDCIDRHLDAHGSLATACHAPDMTKADVNGGASSRRLLPIPARGTTLPLPRPSNPGSTSIPNLFYRRQLLARSVEGLRVDLITITDNSGMSDEFETALGHGLADEGEEPMPLFVKKKVFFVSSRVHPGETPATHMFNGLLAFLLRAGDARAAAARQHFVFKLVPLVNPDGVQRGLYRTDTLGQNLNRCYIAPDPVTQPTVYAIKTYLSFLAQRGLLGFYLDLHAHANRQGVFAYGNAHHEAAALLETQAYARLVALNCPVFEYSKCDFSQSNMSRSDKEGGSKEGAGRVALFRETGLPHMYTVEANYNTSASINALSCISGKPKGSTTPPPTHRTPYRFTAEVLQGVGRALVYAALDLCDVNPWSRLKTSEFKSLQGLKACLAGGVTSKAAAFGSTPSIPALPLTRRVLPPPAPFMEDTHARKPSSLLHSTSAPKIISHDMLPVARLGSDDLAAPQRESMTISIERSAAAATASGTSAYRYSASGGRVEAGTQPAAGALSGMPRRASETASSRVAFGRTSSSGSTTMLPASRVSSGSSTRPQGLRASGPPSLLPPHRRPPALVQVVKQKLIDGT